MEWVDLLTIAVALKPLWSAMGEVYSWKSISQI